VPCRSSQSRRPLVALVVAIGCVLLASAPVHADESSRARAGRARLDAMIKALADRRFDAFAAMFPDTEDSAVMFPSSRTPATGRKAIRAAASDWLGTGRSAVKGAVSGTPTVGQRGDDDSSPRSPHLVVVSADLAVTLKDRSTPAYRATAVLSDELDPANPRALIPTALFISLAVADRDLRFEDKLPESGELDRFLDLLRVPDLLANQFDAGKDDIVIGTSPSDRSVGPAAKKLLEGWHERKYALIGKPHIGRRLDWVYAMATVRWTRKEGKAPINVLLVGYPECKKTCVGTDMTPHVVALHFGQAR